MDKFYLFRIYCSVLPTNPVAFNFWSSSAGKEFCSPESFLENLRIINRIPYCVNGIISSFLHNDLENNNLFEWAKFNHSSWKLEKELSLREASVVCKGGFFV